MGGRPTRSDWVTEDSRGKTAVRALDLKPGKYTIRLKYTFWAAGGEKASATPITGPLQVEVVAPPKGPPVKAAGEWGESKDGLRLRARPVNVRVPAGESPVLDLDVKVEPGGNAVWRTQPFRAQPRVEIDGVWYIPEIGTNFYGFVPTRELKAGEQIDRWSYVSLICRVVSEARDGPAAAARLDFLRPGKHTVRIAVRFTSDLPGGKVVEPVSRPVEIEILPAPVAGRAIPAPWGEPQNGVRLRARPQKTQVAADEYPVFELDVKSDAGGQEWRGPRHGPSAAVEVDGVLYRFSNDEFKKLASHILKAGEQVDGWATVRLDDTLIPQTKEPPGWRFKLSPGKHTIRIRYTFYPDLPQKNTADPVSAPVEIEVLPAPKAPGAVWGESSEGVRLRARAASPRFAADELPVIDLDVKADAAGIPLWQAPRSSEFAQVEVDGTWYSAEIDLRKVENRELKAGQQIDRWVSVSLSSRLISVVKPGQFAKLLDLKPGKHTVRIGYTFYPVAPGAGGAVGTSQQSVEIEVFPAPNRRRLATGLERQERLEARSHPVERLPVPVRRHVLAGGDRHRAASLGRVGPATRKATTYPLTFRGDSPGSWRETSRRFVESHPARRSRPGLRHHPAASLVQTRGALDLMVATLDEQRAPSP